jgi:hypothetical protein
VPEEEQESSRPPDQEYTEASAFGFDHPNVKSMDNVFMVTMNNEHVKRGYIPSSQIESVKGEVGIMGATERLMCGGFYDVETARAIDAGAFTLKRAIESARDGFFVRLEHSQFNYDLMMPQRKQPGFLGRLFGKKEEPQMYAAERR